MLRCFTVVKTIRHFANQYWNLMVNDRKLENSVKRL